MVTCNNCQTSNSLDSLFCKKCGKDLPAELLAEAKSELGRVVAQGFVLFNEGKMEEASLIADLAVKEDPSLTTAISLKGMCHERHGQLADALACYEQVLAICPDSALDKIKVSQLRNHISNSAMAHTAPPPPNRRMAILGGIATVVFVGAVFTWAGALLNHSPLQRVADAAPPAPGNASPFSVIPPTPSGSSQSARAKAAVGVQALPPQSETAAAPAQAPATDEDDSDDTQSRPLEQARPMTTEPVAVQPMVTKVVPDASDNAPSGSGGGSGSSLPDPQPSRPTPKGSVVAASDDPKPLPPGASAHADSDDPGFIEISVSQTAPKTHGGSQEVADGEGSQALSKVAANEFQLKRFEAAAKVYEKLLRTGGDPAYLNQRLGQCYENLGRNGDAVTAYKRAADALKAAISGGQGNLTTEKAALGSCNAAIQVLGGGQ